MLNQNQQDLIAKIKQLEEELRKVKSCKRYGLVWEEKPEIFEQKAKDALPILKENKSLRIGDSEQKPNNIIIEGDNFHSLSVLNYTHKGKIDVIYIDPPYNTGNKDFIYNDHYVDKEDTYRHSKWLSFMNKRLKLAKELLSDDGVIFISIDDNEFAQLKLLCDEVFGEENFIETFIWEKTQHFGRQKLNSYSNGEYVLCYSKKIYGDSIKELLVEYIKEELEDAPLYNASNPEKELIFPKGKVIFNIKDGSYLKSKDKKYILLDKVIIENGKNKNDLKIKFNSRWSQNKINEEIKKGAIFWVKSSNFAIRVIYGKGKTAKESPKKIIFTNKDNPLCTFDRFKNKVGVNEEATKELNNIIESSYFSYPKPVSLIKYLLSLYFNFIDDIYPKNSTILDFFAGSGTTGHATMELNKEDGGNRQFILCSSRENTKEEPDKNICRDITYERNKRVILGYTDSKGKKVEGLGGNLNYYTTEFIKTEKSIDDLRYKFINMCDDLLCVKENTFTKVDLERNIPEIKLFKKQNKFTAILYDVHFFDDLKDILKNINGEISVYIFSLSNDIFEEELIELNKNITLQNIPDPILETYKKIFNF